MGARVRDWKVGGKPRSRLLRTDGEEGEVGRAVRKDERARKMERREESIMGRRRGCNKGEVGKRTNCGDGG